MKKLLFLFTLFFAYNIHAQEKSISIDSLLTLLHEQSQFNGNVLIIQKGEEILKKSYGLANRTTKKALNENSIFELASLSKQFTAAGIILLHREGKLSYTDKLTKYFPELTFCKDVSIKNLLNHSSGIPEYFGLMMKYGDQSKIANNKDVIQMLYNKVDSLDFYPSDQFNYSNTNYLLLASIIEKIEKKSYSDFMKAAIFEPLGMENTFIYNRRYQPRSIPNYADGYVLGARQKVSLPDSLEYYDYVTYLDGIVGDGMVNSTINDLRIWDQSLRRHAFIQQDELDCLQTLDTLNNGAVNTYSFGWNVKKKDHAINMSHSGSWPGYVTYISRDVHADNLIVILQNFDEIVLPVKAIREVLNDEPISTTYKKEIQLSNSVLKQYTGTYLDGEDPNDVTTLSLGQNALIFNSTNNPWDMPFYPDSENTFFSKAPRMNIGFEFVEEKGAMKLVFLQNGKKIGMSVKKE